MNTKYNYFRNEDGSVIALGTRLNSDGIVLDFAAAYCSKKDVFKKKISRELIQERMTGGKTWFIRPSNFTNAEINLACLMELYIRNDYPTWAKKPLLQLIGTYSQKVLKNV